MRPNYRIIKTN